jgi:hypothetical protein
MKNFWQIRSQTGGLTSLDEGFKKTEHESHVEIKPHNYKSPEHAGTAIEHRENPSAYGAGGHGAIDEKIKQGFKDPASNSVGKAANTYSKEHLNKPYDFHDDHPKSSLRKQYTIGKTYELATENKPEYKKAVFDDYAKHRPDIVKQTKAHDYDSLVHGSYKALSSEVNKQFKAMPVKTQYHDGHMSYHNSGEMQRDIHAHNNLAVFRGGDKHEFLHNTDKETGLNENEKFRAVHDYFGHGIHGNQFGAKGEEVAWHSHKKMMTPGASVAMTAETRGQNSAVNYGHSNLETQKTMETHRATKKAALNSGNVAGAQKADNDLREAGSKWNYAKQASVALPSAMLHPHYDGHVPSHIASMLHDPLAKEHKGVYNVKKDHLNLVGLAQHHNTKSHNSIEGGGELDHENAHADLKHIASVHGYHTLSTNPFKKKG